MHELVSRGASLSSASSGGITFAHLACVEGNLPALEFLVESCGPSCLLKGDSDGATPLHWLCSDGTMMHLSTSTLSSDVERPRSFAHGPPSVRAMLSGDKSKATLLSSSKVEVLKWILNNDALCSLVVTENSLQENGFRFVFPSDRLHIFPFRPP